MNRHRVSRLLASGAAAAVVLVGCGSDDADSDESASADSTSTEDTTAATAAPTEPVETEPAETTADTEPVETEPAETTADTEPDTTEGTEPADTTGDTTDTDGAAGSSAAGCDEWIEADNQVTALVMGGQGDPESVNTAIDAAIEATGDEISPTIAELKEVAQPSFTDPEAEPSPELFELYGEAIEWAAASCNVTTLDVVGVDYGYGGMPLEVDAGYTVVNFENQGKELHEMFVVRYNDDTTETLEELFALPEEEAFTKVTPVNAAFAPPGETDTVSLNLAEPGRYVALCAIPVGTVGETEGDGPPHFVEGMFQEFTVS